nr:iron chelate uptake ABC transporter family permease subunit [Cryptosporangium arvum]
MSTIDTVVRGRKRRVLRRRAMLTLLAALIVAAFLVSLSFGRTYYPFADVLDVIAGRAVPGASFTVGELRLPRAVLAALTGFCFGLGGVTFQTMLRNPLASPDIIGISAGAGTAAVFAIVVLGLSETGVSAFAIVAALVVAVLVYTLSFRDGVAGTRLVLIGIGIASMLNSVTSYLLSQAGQWDLQQATRWLAGSLNNATWAQVVPVAVAIVVLTPVLLLSARGLTLLELGDDAAAALGVRLERTRFLVIVAAVGLIAFATAATGPIAFVAFLAGPIAARLFGAGGTLLLPAGLVGALLVLVADFVGQFAFGTRYPVGVITGVLGAPYLIYLIVRSNRVGGSL